MVQHINNESEDQDFIAFAMIPRWLLRSGGKLSSTAIHLYAVIMTYADNITKFGFPSRETLAEDMGVSVATVKRAIKELEEADVVKVKREYNKKTGNFRSNQYTLIYESPWVTDDPRDEEDDSPRVTDDPRPRNIDDPRRRVTDDPITRPTLTKPTELEESPSAVPLLGRARLFVAQGENDDEWLPASRQPGPPPSDVKQQLREMYGKKAS
jgi:hypothetical protein